LHARGPAIFHRNQNSAGIRTIVRANGVNDLLHRDIIWLAICQMILHFESLVMVMV
jgi:hypothetical protein